MKKIIRLTILLIMLLLITAQLIACAGQKNEEIQEDEEPDVQTITANMGDSLTTMFFDFTLNSANVVSSYEDLVPSDANYKLVLVNLTYTSTFLHDISVKDSDFYLIFDGEKKAYTYNALTENMMPLEETLSQGEAKTYDLLFAVPSSETEFSLCYNELYSDEEAQHKEGNTFLVNFTL